jgi:glycosyltransferase involved in cell wall biosynthesis
MAAGVPVVCTRVDGTEEAVTDGVNGVLVPPAQPQALGEAVVALLRDPARAQQLAEAGRRRAQDFSVQKMVADIDALYQELLAQKRVQLDR